MTELIDANDAGSGPTVKARGVKINLSSQEKVRLELSRVYREAKSGELPTEVATRLAYILIGINKMLEAEGDKSDNTVSIVDRDTTLDGIDFNLLNKEQLTALETAVKTIECIREGKPIPLEILTNEERVRILKEALQEI